ncbi:MAG: hypothetical protein GWO07_12645 [Candidatus Dadabacteria bacterium]|nr:hypothetical protein [Candidatus Dadabacteria bacterium]NIS09582.1 hypothetical protein [Candidatus Dadabacteria bacterium]NIV43108.1 hypothetical protein [Candidatus Dadabacteria bacterium]NIX16064.1 hypothetical protein [Candidatus Dadabacteria bacterium]NIY22759.1 hypothetical protein [Candidatus Dadabacteria bacterium]
MKKITTKILILAFMFSFLTLSLYSQADPAISAYDEYIEAINNANSLHDLNPYISKRKIETYGAMTEEKKKSTLKFKKQIVRFTERKDIEAQSQGDNSMITVNIIDKSSNNPATVEVNMVSEGGKWKLDKEKYKF